MILANFSGPLQVTVTMRLFHSSDSTVSMDHRIKPTVATGQEFLVLGDNFSQYGTLAFPTFSRENLTHNRTSVTLALFTTMGGEIVAYVQIISLLYLHIFRLDLF
jgi:hypothetical protein